MHIQRHHHKSKHIICCYANIFLGLCWVLLIAFLVFRSKRRLSGIFHCVFATEFPLKLNAGFCCKKMLILQECKTCADISGSCVSGMIESQSQWHGCMVLAWDLGNEYSSLCNCIFFIRGTLRWPKPQPGWYLHSELLHLSPGSCPVWPWKLWWTSR